MRIHDLNTASAITEENPLLNMDTKFLKNSDPLSELRSDTLHNCRSSNRPGFLSRAWGFVSDAVSKIYGWIVWVCNCCPTDGVSTAQIRDGSKTKENKTLSEIAKNPAESAKLYAKSPKDFLEMLADQFVENPENFIKAYLKHREKLNEFDLAFEERIGATEYNLLALGENDDLAQALWALKINQPATSIFSNEAQIAYNALWNQFLILVPSFGKALAIFSNRVAGALDRAPPSRRLSTEQEAPITYLKNLFKTGVPELAKEMEQHPEKFYKYFAEMRQDYQDNKGSFQPSSALIQTVFKLVDCMSFSFLSSPAKTLLKTKFTDANKNNIRNLFTRPQTLLLSHFALDYSSLMRESLKPFFEQAVGQTFVTNLLSIFGEDHPAITYLLTKIQDLWEDQERVNAFRISLANGLVLLINDELSKKEQV